MHFDHVAYEAPDIDAAVAWIRETIPACTVRYQDATWALVEAGGVRIAFVTPGQHPNHLAWRVSHAELQRLSDHHGEPIKTHRDGSKSFYLTGPGGLAIELVAFSES